MSWCRPSLVALLVLWMGCRPPASGVARSQYDGEIRSREVSRGSYVFHHVCAVCHEGRVNPAGYGWEPGHMRYHVRQGNSKMPAISTSLVDDEDLEAVLAYLTTIGAVVGELPPPPDESPDTGAVDEEAGGLDPPFGE